MADERERPEVLEVEVERLPEDQGREHGHGGGPWGPVGPARRPRGAIGPVLAGVLLDGIDLATPSVPLGLLIGGPAGYVLARGQGLPRGRSLAIALLAALYCAAPMTPRLPLATLVGLYARFVRGA